MVPIGHIVRCALKHDTLMSWAFRRALHIVGRPRQAVREERRPESEPEERRFDPDLMYCFRNEHPVMDGVHR